MTTGRQVAKAFENGNKLSSGNYWTDGKIYTLFGNTIARKTENGEIEISNCGYNTVTTTTALNYLSGVSATQRKGIFKNHGVEIEDDVFVKVHDQKFIDARNKAQAKIMEAVN